MKKIQLILAATLCLGGCATSGTKVWRADRHGSDLILTPPAARKSIVVRDCTGKQKVPPAAVIARRGNLIRSEDDGCLPPGSAAVQMRQALESHPVSGGGAARALYGSSGTWVDLHPGWRLRVITPLLKSGGYRLQKPQAEADTAPGGTLTVRTDGDFLGMETSWYAVQPRSNEPGVQIRFTAAEAIVDGNTQSREKPAASLFQLPADSRRVRLLYLTRVSAADHDMLVLSGRSVTDLEELTTNVQSNPAEACRATAYCTAVPAGIAVRTEFPVTVDGAVKWFPTGATARDARAIALLRPWRGKAIPVEGEISGVPLIEGDVVRTR